MAWEFGQRYRFKVCQGQVIGKRTPNTRTPLVEAMCEVTQGPMQGRRLPYSGYLNTKENAARTRGDLVNMGWRGKKWGDWSGLGSGVEFEAVVLADERPTGIFPRLAFPRPIRRVNTDHAMRDNDLESLNEELGDFAQLDAIAEAQRHDRDNFAGYEEDYQGG